MNNFFPSCPALMADDRIFTDYRSPIVREETNKRVANINRDDNFRMFLQQNGKNIMSNDWMNLEKMGKCFKNSCVHHQNRTISNNAEFAREFRDYNIMMKKYPTSKKNCNIN